MSDFMEFFVFRTEMTIKYYNLANFPSLHHH